MRSLTRRNCIPITMVCLALAGAWGLCRQAAGQENAADNAPALKGLDPVLLTQGRESKGRAEISVTREGFRYVFVDVANKAKFEKDPQRYEIQLHGKCALMPKATGDPDLFTVYKGKIYVFGTEDCRTAFRESPEEYLQPRNDGSDRTAVILVFDHMELLDFAGPAEVLAAAGFKVSTVAATRAPVTCAGIVTITPRYTVEDCPRSDIIVVPGGNTSDVAKDKRVIDWLARASSGADLTLSVCTGAFVLANAGLLDGKEATTHWGSIIRLQKQFPKVTVRDDRRVVDGGKIVTSAGVSAGIDGALHAVERLCGKPIATKTARYMEYNWQPPSEAKK